VLYNKKTRPRFATWSGFCYTSLALVVQHLGHEPGG